MFQLQLVIGLFIGFQLNAVNKITNSLPLKYTENEFKVDNYTDDVLDLSYLGQSLHGKTDPSMHERLQKAFEKESQLPDMVVLPEEYGTYLEGDLLIPIDNDDNDFQDYRTFGLKFHYWPNGIVPYKLTATFEPNDVEKIKIAMMQIQSRTCIRFRKRTTEKNFVYIDDAPYGCFSAVGNIGRQFGRPGWQILNLHKPYCLNKITTIQHQLMHTLGFLHEHNRFNRDFLLKISWENIAEGKAINFKKMPYEISPKIHLDYDYNSIMHYSHYFNNKAWGLKTMSPLVTTLKSSMMGQRKFLSPGDVEKICTRYCTTKRKPTHQRRGGIKLKFKNNNTMIDLEFNP